jgi:hypothetical protein
MNSFATIEAYTAAAAADPDNFIPAAFVAPMLALTRRPVAVGNKTVRAYLTPYRFVEFTLEPDGWLSAWAVGTMLVSGRKITTAVLATHVHDATKMVSALRGCGARLSEVMSGGGSVAPLLGEGVWSDPAHSTRDYDGVTVPGRVLMYRSPTMDQNMAVERCVTFMLRNSIELAKKTETAKTTKSKAKVAPAQATA